VFLTGFVLGVLIFAAFILPLYWRTEPQNAPPVRSGVA